MLKFMLDTNIVIYTIKHRPEKVRTAFKRHHGQMCVSTVTVGELVFGAERSANPEKNLEVVEGFLARVEVMPFEQQDAEHFGQIKAELSFKGNPIGPYDMMIAGQARARGLTLVTNNMKEFIRVKGLRLDNWVR